MFSVQVGDNGPRINKHLITKQVNAEQICLFISALSGYLPLAGPAAFELNLRLMAISMPV